MLTWRRPVPRSKSPSSHRLSISTGCKKQYIYQDSNTIHTLQLWYIRFLPGFSGKKLSVRSMLLCPKQSINQFKPVKQTRKQMQRANCRNIYTVVQKVCKQGKSLGVLASLISSKGKSHPGQTLSQATQYSDKLCFLKFCPVNYQLIKKNMFCILTFKSGGPENYPAFALSRQTENISQLS